MDWVRFAIAAQTQNAPGHISSTTIIVLFPNTYNNINNVCVLDKNIYGWKIYRKSKKSSLISFTFVIPQRLAFLKLDLFTDLYVEFQK